MLFNGFLAPKYSELGGDREIDTDDALGLRHIEHVRIEFRIAQHLVGLVGALEQERNAELAEAQIDANKEVGRIFVTLDRAELQTFYHRCRAAQLAAGKNLDLDAAIGGFRKISASLCPNFSCMSPRVTTAHFSVYSAASVGVTSEVHAAARMMTIAAI